MTKIYFAGVDGSSKDVKVAVQSGATHFMLSFYYKSRHKSPLKVIKENNCDVMLYSGAYSAWKKEEIISLEDYIEYIQNNNFNKYVVLDVVGDPEQTNYNLRKMEEANLSPLPVFHIGTDWAVLDDYVSRYSLICIGGTVGKPKQVRNDFFTEVFERHPNHKFHGLGMTTPEFLHQFPWYSVDSTTWLIGKKNFKVQTDNGQKDLPRTMTVEDRIAANVKYFTDLQKKLKKVV